MTIFLLLAGKKIIFEPAGQVPTSTREPQAAWKKRGGSVCAGLAPECITLRPTRAKDSVGSLSPSWTLAPQKMRGLRMARADFSGRGLLKSARLPHSRHFRRAQPLRSRSPLVLPLMPRSKAAKIRAFSFRAGVRSGWLKGS